MKKLLFVAAVAAFTTTSCKKDYTCECNIQTDTLGIVTNTTSSTVIRDKKKNAITTCNAGDSNVSFFGISTTTECEIK